MRLAYLCNMAWRNRSAAPAEEPPVFILGVLFRALRAEIVGIAEDDF